MFDNLMNIAQPHSNKNESAMIAFNDAKRIALNANYSYAGRRALFSIRHAVGVFHEDYKKAESIFNELTTQE